MVTLKTVQTPEGVAVVLTPELEALLCVSSEAGVEGQVTADGRLVIEASEVAVGLALMDEYDQAFRDLAK